MSKKTLTLAAACCLLALPFAALAEEEEVEKEVRVTVERIHVDCEEGDEDCHKKIIIRHADGRAAHSAGRTRGRAHAMAMARAGGEHARGGHLGVQLTELTDELLTHFGIPEDSGVLISKVLDDSPAFEAGLEVGDIVTAIDGEAISGPGDLARNIRAREDGETVVVEAWRDGKLQQLSATLTETESPYRRAHVIECEDGEDCDFDLDLDFGHGSTRVFEWEGDSFDFDFGCEGEDCEVEVLCDDDGCDCTVNGEDSECPEVLDALHP